MSARLFHQRVVAIYRASPGSTKPPTSLEGQVCAAKRANFYEGVLWVIEEMEVGCLRETMGRK